MTNTQTQRKTARQATLFEALEGRCLLATDAHGLNATYFDNMDLNGASVSRIDSAINFNWQTGSPDPSIGSDTFSARWIGQIQAPTSGNYTFHSITDDGVRLWVGGQLIIDRWQDQSTVNEATITLQAGQRYDFKMEYYEHGGGSIAALAWSAVGMPLQFVPSDAFYLGAEMPTVNTNGFGLSGEYFNNTNLTAPAITRTDPRIDFNWGTGSPDASIDAETFSARWTGTIIAPETGVYTFFTRSDDGVRLWLDQTTIIDQWDEYHPDEFGSIHLTAGREYSIKMEYYEQTGHALADLQWKLPSATMTTVVPNSALRPTKPVNTFDVTQYGARANDKTDDSAAIMSAVKALQANGGGRLLFPEGVYQIRQHMLFQGLTNCEIIGNKATLRSADNAPNTRDFGILRLNNCSNFKMEGLTFDANSAKRGRREGTNTVITRNCSAFKIAGCTFLNAVGDHLFIGATFPENHATGTRDGVIEHNVFDNAHRNAISVIHGYRLTINNNLITNVNGTAPASAIDVEPNKEDGKNACHDIQIIANRIENCAGYGIIVSYLARSRDITIQGNEILRTAYSIVVSGDNIRVLDNSIRDVTRRTKGTLGWDGMCAIYVQYKAGFAGSTNVEIRGNTIANTKGLSGIVVAPDAKSVIVAGNTLKNLAGPVEHPWAAAIWVGATGASVTNNTVEESTIKTLHRQ